MRTESDLLGELEVPAEAYWGIHTQRALKNFAVSRSRVHPVLIKAFGAVKQACAQANHELGYLGQQAYLAVNQAADEVRQGEWYGQFPLDAVQGGAGTSTNMNANEVIANRALEILGFARGRYDIINPHDHVNLHQSTNDVYPTALRVAAIWMLLPLAETIASLQEAIQEKEAQSAGVLKLGRTQLMDAVPITAGQEFSAWAQAVARDRWRLYKVEERLRQVSLGGTAVGTGLNAPLNYVYLVNDKLRQIAGRGIARSENMIDAIQNQDVFVEVSGLLKAAATNLMKIANDLRLLSSGPVGGIAELRIPAVQAGSSIMPGKVNPVIPEMVGQVAIRVMANDQAITTAASMGQLELNAFVPAIAHHLLDSLEVMTNGVRIFTEQCVRGMEVDPARCGDLLSRSIGVVTALIPYLGYETAQQVYQEARREGRPIHQVVKEMGLLGEEELTQILNPKEMTRPGIAGGRPLGVSHRTTRQE
ncbi:MAG: aspartate ammonia-lyase [Firmicutes bacterium]|nr:aspartate ammonia-lyase [Bacillota bacterium]